MRYTDKDARNCFSLLMDAMNVPDSKRADKGSCFSKAKGGKFKVDCYSLDTNHIYGGHMVDKTVNEGGGVTAPMGMSRKSSREFCEAVHFATRVLDEKKRRRK